MRYRPLALTLVLACSGGPAPAGVGGDAGESGAESDGSLDHEDDTMAASADGSAGAGVCENLPPTDVVARTPQGMAIAGDPGSPLGVYDPSLAGGALAYSSIAPEGVHTRVAVTADRGATFAFVAEPNALDPLTLTNPDGRVCGAPTCPGVFWHETPSLVHDPGDPDPARAYKLFVVTFVALKRGTDLHRAWGYVGLQTAPRPEGPWSAETKLLGWPSDATVSLDGVVEDLAAFGSLADCVSFTEPGGVVTPFGLDLALTCLSDDGDRIGMRVVLLRSRDHAQTFALLGPLVQAADARCLGSALEMVTGANPFFVGGTEYVALTPIGATPPPGSAGFGCVTVAVESVETGALARDAQGSPRAARLIEPEQGGLAGGCAYSDDTGYLLGERADAGAAPFRVVPTGVREP